MLFGQNLGQPFLHAGLGEPLHEPVAVEHCLLLGKAKRGEQNSGNPDYGDHESPLGCSDRVGDIRFRSQRSEVRLCCERVIYALEHVYDGASVVWIEASLLESVRCGGGVEGEGHESALLPLCLSARGARLTNVPEQIHEPVAVEHCFSNLCGSHATNLLHLAGERSTVPARVLSRRGESARPPSGSGLR